MSSKERLAWVDAARAFSIIAIVLLHLNIWFMPSIASAYPDISFWGKLISLTGPFRLPVLFALSGFLVSNRVRAGWRGARISSRLIGSIWLYVVWLLIYAYLSNELPGPQPVGIPWNRLMHQLIIPETPLWFVLFLALHTAILVTLNRVHPAIVLSGAAALSWFSIQWSAPSGWAMVDRGLYYLFFLALGVYGKQILLYFGSRAGLWWRVPVLLVMAYISIDALRNTKVSLGYLGVIFLRDVTAIICVISVMAAICIIPVIAKFLGFLGSRTLPVYVMHVPIIWVLMIIRDEYFSVFTVPVVRYLSPIIALTAVLTISIGLHAIARRFYVGRLFFEMPPFLAKLLTSPTARAHLK